MTKSLLQCSLLFLLLLYGLCCPALLSAQHKRRVLLEEFTRASCQPCAQQNPGFNAVVANNAQYVTPVMYQSSHGATDIMFLQSAKDVVARESYYRVWGTPFLYINGFQSLTGVSGVTGSKIRYEYEKKTPVFLDLKHRLNATFDTVEAEILVRSDSALSAGLRLFVGITEARVSFATPPGSNGEKEFPHVMRKLLPDAGGTVLPALPAGQPLTFRLKWAVENFYDLNQLAATAWVQDYTSRVVWQSARSLPNTSIAGGAFVKMSANLLDVLTHTCQQSFKAKVNLQNPGTTDVTSATILYGEKGMPQDTFFWKGILWVGGTLAVTLPDYKVQHSGFNTFTVRILETNQGRALNLADTKVTFYRNAFYQNVSPAQVAADFEGERFPPDNWGLANTIFRPDVGWIRGSAGANGSAAAAVCSFRDVSAGWVNTLLMPKVSLNTPETWSLTFRHAYAPFLFTSGPSKDSLAVFIHQNCTNMGIGTVLYGKGGTRLQTAPAINQRFVPVNDQWADNTIDLSTWKGKDNLFVQFKGISNGGNDLYIDDVRLVPNVSTAYREAPLLEGVRVFPNPAHTTFSVDFTLLHADQMRLALYNSSGQLVLERTLGQLPAGAHQFPVSEVHLPAGVYTMALHGTQGVAAYRLVSVW